MAPPRKRSTRPLATFAHPVRVEVRRPAFELLASVPYLDVGRLTRAARAEFEVGQFGDGDCRALVRAVVRRGMVTELVAEPCPSHEPERASPELVRLLNTAARRAATGAARPPKLPVPVADFVSAAQGITVSTIICIQVCVLGFCFVCCQMAHFPGQWVCGKQVVVKT